MQLIGAESDIMRGVFKNVAIIFASLCASFALAATPNFDKDIVITSAMKLDGVWTFTVRDLSRNKTATFDASKTQTKIGLKLLDFDPDACVACFDSFRGNLKVTLANPDSTQDLSSDQSTHGDAYREAFEEVLAAMEGKVTKKYRASLWRRIPKS